MRQLFKKKLSKLGHLVEEFVLHSLCVGGDTVAARVGLTDHYSKNMAGGKQKGQRKDMWRIW